MLYVNILIFLNRCLSFSFCTQLKKFIDRKTYHKVTEWNMLSSVSKKSVLALSHITINYLHFTLISMVTVIICLFQN